MPQNNMNMVADIIKYNRRKNRLKHLYRAVSLRYSTINLKINSFFSKNFFEFWVILINAAYDAWPSAEIEYFIAIVLYFVAPVSEQNLYPSLMLLTVHSSKITYE